MFRNHQLAYSVLARKCQSLLCLVSGSLLEVSAKSSSIYDLLLSGFQDGRFYGYVCGIDTSTVGAVVGRGGARSQLALGVRAK